MNKESKSICEKHNLEICEDCMRNGVWTFPNQAPDDVLAKAEYKIMAAIGNLDGEQMTNENGELFIKYIDVQNALSQTIMPAVSQLLLSTRAEAREETLNEVKEIVEKMKMKEVDFSDPFYATNGRPELERIIAQQRDTTRERNSTVRAILKTLSALSKKEI